MNSRRSVLFCFFFIIIFWYLLIWSIDLERLHQYCHSSPTMMGWHLWFHNGDDKGLLPVVILRHKERWQRKYVNEFRKYYLIAAQSELCCYVEWKRVLLIIETEDSIANNTVIVSIVVYAQVSFIFVWNISCW